MKKQHGLYSTSLSAADQLAFAAKVTGLADHLMSVSLTNEAKACSSSAPRHRNARASW